MFGRGKFENILTTYNTKLSREKAKNMVVWKFLQAT